MSRSVSSGDRVRRPGAFVAVAAMGFAVQAAVLVVLTSAGLHLTPATALAVLAAIVHNFVWHERWTWGDRTRRDTLPMRLLRFAGATGFVSLAGTVALTTAYAAALHVPVVVSNLLAVWTVGLVNYLLLDRVVYQEAR